MHQFQEKCIHLLSNMYLDKGKIIAPIFLLHALVDIISDKLVYLSEIPYIPSDFVTSQHYFCQKMVFIYLIICRTIQNCQLLQEVFRHVQCFVDILEKICYELVNTTGVWQHVFNRINM